MLLSSFFNILYIVLAIFGILAIGGLTGKEREEKKNVLKADDVEVRYHEMPDPKVNDSFSTYVAGSAFYCDKNDLRCFVGFVYFDPDDEAPRIYRNDMRMMGHIPRERLEEYMSWCHEESTYPCVGYVLRGRTPEQLSTELKIFKPYNRKYVEREIRNYVSWVVMKNGIEANILPEIYDPVLDDKGRQRLRQLQKQNITKS